MSSFWQSLFIGPPTGYWPTRPGGGRPDIDTDRPGGPSRPGPSDTFEPSADQLGLLEELYGIDFDRNGEVGSVGTEDATGAEEEEAAAGAEEEQAAAGAEEEEAAAGAEEEQAAAGAEEEQAAAGAEEEEAAAGAEEEEAAAGAEEEEAAAGAEEPTAQEHLASLRDNVEDIDAADGTSDNELTQAGLWAYADQEGVSAEDKAAANYFGDNFETLDPDGNGSVNQAGFLNGDLADQLEEAEPTPSDGIDSDAEALYHLSTVEDLSSAQDGDGDPLFSADDLDQLSRGQGRFEDATEQQQAAATYVRENDDLEGSLDATNTDGALDSDEADREDDWYSTGALKQPKAVAENKETLAEPKEDPPADEGDDK